MRFSGKLTTWQDERGFGFISLTQGGEEIFLHIKMFPRTGARPQLGEVLTFEVASDPQGKRRAVNVQRAGAAPPSLRGRRKSVALRHRVSGLLMAAASVGLYWICQKLWGIPLPVAIACLATLAMSLLTFGVYGVDKAAARSARQRVPETVLHLLSLAGGWPGALLAQQMLHHKRAKPPFMRRFRLTMLGHLAITLALVAGWMTGWWR